MNVLLFKRKSKKIYLTIALLLFIIELIIERFAHDDFIRPYLGDFLVVILLYSIVMFLSSIKVFTAAIFTLLFAYLIEFAQYLQLVTLLGLDKNQWAAVIIGTSFSWWDMLMYSLGILFVLIAERFNYE